jgi:mRNA-degrading endonuclease toxin of MazEF toxin-antitoxin module
VPHILQGSIVRARVLDPAGENPKLRPLVVVTVNSEIAKSETLFAVAITGDFSEPLAAEEVALPWHPRGASRTRLTKPCVAKCSWLCELKAADVVEIRGHVPAAQLEDILKRLASL